MVQQVGVVDGSPVRGDRPHIPDAAHGKHVGFPYSRGWATAHEATHALQHQNYPQLAAIHLWHNRDLAAAANAALEGDAHVVGWAFDPAWRLSVCSNSYQTVANLGPRWGWRPDGYWAAEGSPHVFGPALALERQLAKGNAGVDELVQACSGDTALAFAEVASQTTLNKGRSLSSGDTSIASVTLST